MSQSSRPIHNLYFNESGFRWCQRVMTGSAPRRTRKDVRSSSAVVLRSSGPAVVRCLQVSRWTTAAADRTRRYPGPVRRCCGWVIKAACRFEQIVQRPLKVEDFQNGAETHTVGLSRLQPSGERRDGGCVARADTGQPSIQPFKLCHGSICLREPSRIHLARVRINQSAVRVSAAPTGSGPLRSAARPG